MTVLTIGKFAGLGMGIVPKHPAGFCCRPVPKRHSATTCYLTNPAPIAGISALWRKKGKPSGRPHVPCTWRMYPARLCCQSNVVFDGIQVAIIAPN